MSMKINNLAAIALALGFCMSHLICQTPVSIPKPMVQGTVITPGGGICSGVFLVDSGATNCFISQQCAAGAGLGTVGGPNSTFTPDPSLGAVCKTHNNGAFMSWCFPGLTLSAIDSKGHICFKSIQVCVVKDLSNGQSKTFNKGVISNTWLSCVGGSILPYSQVCWGSAAQFVNTAASQAATMQSNLLPGPMVDTYVAVLGGVPTLPGGTAPQLTVDVRISTSSHYSFIPVSVAQALNLTVTGSVDLSVVDPGALESLEIMGERLSDQVVFQEAILPSFSWTFGPDRTDRVLLVDDGGINRIVIGGNGTRLFEEMILVYDAAYSPTPILSMGVPTLPPAPPYDVLAPTPAASALGTGSLNIAPIVPEEGFLEGMTLVSMDTSGAPSAGPLFGLTPDTFTWACVNAPLAQGSVFHFPDVAGMFPNEEVQFPQGVFSQLIGFEVDIGMVYVTPSRVAMTAPMRVNF